MLKTICLAGATAFGLFLGTAAVALEPLNITWDDLLPEERRYPDPFVDMKYEQLNDLADLYRIEVLKDFNENESTRARAQEIRETLASQGLDADELFQQREFVMEQRMLAATEPNPDLLGKDVRLPGYLLPLEMEGQKAVEFLLVPTVGACIHTPPPPANQMVFVRFEQGFDVDELFKPVWISGEMRVKNQSSALQLVDGQTEIATTYFVEAVTVDVYN